jgi:hypothetical protein
MENRRGGRTNLKYRLSKRSHQPWDAKIPTHRRGYASILSIMTPTMNNPWGDRQAAQNSRSAGTSNPQPLRRDQRCDRRTGISLTHEGFSDQDSLGTGIYHYLNIISRMDPRFADDHNIALL